MTKMAEISLNRYPIFDQNGSKTIPFGAAHTYIVHIRGPPPPLPRDNTSPNILHTCHNHTGKKTGDLYLRIQTKTMTFIISLAL